MPDRPSLEARIGDAFGALMALVFLFGLFVRIAYVTLARLPGLPGDARTFRSIASNLAHGEGYSAPFGSHPGKLVATAVHPPLFPVLLTAFDLIGVRSVSAQRIALACVTSSSVLVMGLLGRKLAGSLVGVVAALIAAVNPLWLGLTASLLSESIYLIVIPLMLLLALRCVEQPSPLRFAALGIVTGLAVLIRSEAVFFSVLLDAPLLILTSVSWKVRSILALSLLSGLILTVGPWLIRNEVQIGGAVLSTNQGGTLAGSYCNSSFDPAGADYGAFSGTEAVALAAFVVKYEKPPDPKTGWTELSLDRALTSEAETYARQHLGQIPGVMLAREAATWDLSYSNDLTVAVDEGRNRTVEKISFVLIGCSFRSCSSGS